MTNSHRINRHINVLVEYKPLTKAIITAKHLEDKVAVFNVETIMEDAVVVEDTVIMIVDDKVIGGTKLVTEENVTMNGKSLESTVLLFLSIHLTN